MTMYKIDFTPVAKGRPKFTRTGRAYTPQKTRVAELELAEQVRDLGLPVSNQGVHLTIVFHIPIKDKRKWGKPNLARPDLDNYLKLFLDSCNEILWQDDGQVYSITASKLYAQKGAIYFQIKGANNENKDDEQTD